ncbi:hypothetical protein LX15_005840 [Streptoalloteichus tenebrarius]|uniref:Anti-sigma factor n=1 Tax=Streptoalloteichus tenebrarius (strain ATCC 17920 / DSM 40477 / JCM 4838 / CBS 697.72 / NBRC 16177 / NCIMB 11028 / NRRL B-12390 / A12253. 1 / ISP 5477) TaxID=1933 RepID=A0ABT1I2U1_STRSD|nr:hypothetical protein [Streptoalloteichus tenebrarius]MCP2262108.1 hypothetical protein [Streptoalloteichus tenebrarius]BFF02262.1 hypothetical protein GCM10020241_39370 [Streptoalloteichus tenebrarius]
MDEHKLAALFRDAARDAPPASFDERDVAAASRRATVRQRTALALGSAFGVAVLFGGVAVGTGLFDREPDSQPTSLSAPDEQASAAREHGSPPAPHTGPGTLDPGATEKAPSARPPGGPQPHDIPEDPPEQGGGTSGSAGPGTGGTRSGCGPADRGLAIALAGELPAAAGLEPNPVAGDCPAGATGAAFVVRDRDVVGVVSVVLGPEGSGRGSGELSRADGSRGFVAVTPGGRSLTVLSQPQKGSTTPPYADQVADVARRLATRY